MTTIFRTRVAYLPPTPLGLLPGRWAVEHYCDVCRSRVQTDDLIPHAQAHATAATVEESLQDRVP